MFHQKSVEGQSVLTFLFFTEMTSSVRILASNINISVAITL